MAVHAACRHIFAAEAIRRASWCRKARPRAGTRFAAVSQHTTDRTRTARFKRTAAQIGPPARLRRDRASLGCGLGAPWEAPEQRGKAGVSARTVEPRRRCNRQSLYASMTHAGIETVREFRSRRSWRAAQGIPPQHAAAAPDQGREGRTQRSDAYLKRTGVQTLLASAAVLGQVLPEKIDAQPQGAVRFRFAVGPAAVPRERVIGAGILVYRHERIG